jgi:hypothetical protein
MLTFEISSAGNLSIGRKSRKILKTRIETDRYEYLEATHSHGKAFRIRGLKDSDIVTFWTSASPRSIFDNIKIVSARIKYENGVGAKFEGLPRSLKHGYTSFPTLAVPRTRASWRQYQADSRLTQYAQ